MALRLEYFDLRGFGEYIRTLLIDNGIDFTDDRVKMEEWTPEKKETMPLGQMPVLNVGELKIPQTGAIMRYLARKHDLYGANECEATFLDVVHETLKDLRHKFGVMAYTDWDSKEKFDNETYPTELKKLEKLITSRGNFDKLLLGEKPSFVDYILFEELDLALASNPKNLDGVPALKAYHDRFLERPGLKAYIAKRSADKVPFTGNGKI